MVVALVEELRSAQVDADHVTVDPDQALASHWVEGENLTVEGRSRAAAGGAQAWAACDANPGFLAEDGLRAASRAATSYVTSSTSNVRSSSWIVMIASSRQYPSWYSAADPCRLHRSQGIDEPRAPRNRAVVPGQDAEDIKICFTRSGCPMSLGKSGQQS